MGGLSMAVGIGLAIQSPPVSYVGVIVGALGAIATTAMMIANAARHPVHIGAEGLWIAGVFRDELVSFADVDRIERAAGAEGTIHHGMIVTTKAGRQILVGPSVGRMAEGARDTERLLAAFDAYRARVPGEVPLGLAPEGASKDEWIARLTSRRRGGGLREGALDREALLAVSEDPTTVPSARAAAAFLLREGITPTEQARLRVAAEDAASPRVRVALAAAADDDDDAALEGALKRLARPG